MNYEDIKKLIEDMGNSKIDSLDIEFPEGMKISMKKNETKEKLTKKEEVSQIKWFDFDDCINKVKHNLIKHCIYLEELEIVKKGIQND